MITLRPATQEDADYVSQNLRQEDITDLTVLGFDPVSCVLDSFATTEGALALVIDGVPVAIGGVDGTEFPKVGLVWAVGTPGVDRNPVAFCKFGIVATACWHTFYPTLTNLIRQDNTRYIRWLKWMGFVLGDPVTINGVVFHPHKRTSE